MTRLTPRPAVVLAFALAGGLVDAASYLGLGRVFTANMTGNTVLLAVAVARGSGGDAAGSGVALAGFCVGVAVGAALLRAEDSAWPRAAGGTLAVETLGLAVLLLGWALLGQRVRYGLIAVSAAAMGAQSATVRASHAAGVNTTYVTGTLTNAIARAVARTRKLANTEQGPSLPGSTWAVYGIGALGGGVAVRVWHAGAIALPLAVVCGISALAMARSLTKEG
jgi:uncharacterized membrane protein YoaK (UPF0700 family)